jgi:hypothetical protein
MRRILALAGLVAMVCSAGAAAASPTRPWVWTGFVTDTHCQMTSKMRPDAHCVRLCVSRGSKYGLWAGNRVYVLSPQSRVVRYAAEDLKVSGTLLGGTLHVSTIELLRCSSRANAGH